MILDRRNRRRSRCFLIASCSCVLVSLVEEYRCQPSFDPVMVTSGPVNATALHTLVEGLVTLPYKGGHLVHYRHFIDRLDFLIALQAAAKRLDISPMDTQVANDLAQLLQRVIVSDENQSALLELLPDRFRPG